jgi:hypothetical protein
VDSCEAFIHYRFERPLLSYFWRGPWYGRAFTFFSVGVIVAGLASSGIAAWGDPSNRGRWAILALGSSLGG